MIYYNSSPIYEGSCSSVLDVLPFLNTDVAAFTKVIPRLPELDVDHTLLRRRALPFSSVVVSETSTCEGRPMKGVSVNTIMIRVGPVGDV